jgi:SagB-type dehydrogenase family enzyme
MGRTMKPFDSETGRFFLKDTIRKLVDFRLTEQSRGLPPPPVQKPAPAGAPRVRLPHPDAFDALVDMPLLTALRGRRSVRSFSDEPLKRAELAFLLWAAQGVRAGEGPPGVFRTVPSAGARHPFETHVAALRVEDIACGLYRYLPLDHELVLLRAAAAGQLAEEVTKACLGQRFAGQAAATFLWTAIPRRTEWRYGPASYKVIAVDAGHVGQNVYLACGAIGAGTCAIGAYDQEACDELLGVDGREEFTVYIAPVGKPGWGA